MPSQFLSHEKSASQTSLRAISGEQELAFWMISFSTSHIGMSAIRDKLISGCGQLASYVNLVDRGVKLPSYWPGDNVGKDELFPDAGTAGRQLYRLFYTIVSFVTLGGAFSTYLAVDDAHVINLTDTQYMVCSTIVALSGALSLSSAVNASPLSLVPSFQKSSDDSSNEIDPGKTFAGIERNDALKFEPRGLTRITRHPLILPVVPWGVATSFLAGGRLADFIIFCGLALYAIAGCACQDLRIVREEGSIGTVFETSNADINSQLNAFYAQTSFVPFGALQDGRQSWSSLIKEFPILPFMASIPLAVLIENAFLQSLSRV